MRTIFVIFMIVAVSLAAGCAKGKKKVIKDEASDPAGEIEKQFPDYKPKTSEDTVLDYRRSLAQLLDRIPPTSPESLPDLFAALASFQVEAQKNPGTWTEGNVILGADPRQYVPSDEELLVSETGRRIQYLLDKSSLRMLRELLPQDIDALSYGAIKYRHVDVMGSGRFFYASEPVQTSFVVPLE